MNKNRLLFLMVFVFVFANMAVFGQENNVPPPDGTSCSCSDPSANCSASATCPDGSAVCVCSSNGCTSYCINNFAPMGEFPDVGTLKLNLINVQNNQIGNVLTKAFGKTVNFIPSKNDFRFDSSVRSENHWDILEYLSQNGELTINKGDFGLWKKMQEIVTTGKMSFCSKNITIGRLVNELSFFGGKKYQIVSGDPGSRVTIDIKGLTVEGVIDALEQHHRLLIKKS